MKKKKSTALFLAMLMIASIFLNTTSVFAESGQEIPKVNQIEEVEGEDKKALEVKAEEGLDISGEEMPEAVGEPAAEKTFTVTKKVGDTEVEVGNYDKFYDAVGAMDINDKSTFYTIYVNEDTAIPEDQMGGYYRTNNKFRITSGTGGPYTLKREGTWGILGIQTDAELTVDNITLDGNGTTQCFFITNNGVVTIGSGTTIQNFIDTKNEDGPAIYMTGGTLNIFDGATIQNNNSNTQGGVIQAYNGTTVNISGGTFKNNKSERDGGAIAAYGSLNITGGIFENNEAKKTSGAIIIGKNRAANISNTTFKGNKASTGGAIYSSKKFSVSKATFENNTANWGGAIFASKKLTLNDVTFKNNKVTSAGGALYLQGGADINKTNFIENTADINGGAIYIKKGDSNIKECVFTKNGTQAIFIAHENNGTTTISDTTFTENYSTSFGGGIYLGINSKLDIANSTFTKNEAPYGAGIASAGIGNVDKGLTNIKVDSSTFTDNLSLMGAGIFTAFPTEINNCTFTKNKADVHPQDDQTNPHSSGVGGAIEVMDNKIVIKSSTFEENWAYGSGGALGINGVARDKTKNIASIKPNISVEISEGTKFIKNICGVGQGGAIFTIPYLYDIEGYETGVPKDTLKEKAYSNLTTSDNTVFKDNVALSGFVDPPKDYTKYTNLKFERNSFKDVLPGKDVSKSLLNNYDVNYKNNKLSAFFDPNDGEFKDGENPKDIRPVKGETGKEITLLDAPKRDGYKFTGWKCLTNIPEDILKKLSEGAIKELKELPKEVLEQLKEGKIYKPGDKFKLDADYIFVAQWEKEEPKPEPEPKPQENVYTPFFYTAPALNKEDHYQYLIGYKDDTFKPENNMTREEVAVMFSRLLKNPPTKGKIYNYNFTDVERDRWSTTAISYMSELGIINGYPDGTFRPQASITRAEFASIAAKFAELKEGNKTFSDLDRNHWAYEIVSRAATAGWINGYPDGTFKPDSKITRAEVVSITNLMMNRKADEKYVDSNLDKLLKYSDVTKNHWAYYKIFEATNGHDFVRQSNKIDEEWKDITNKSFVYDK